MANGFDLEGFAKELIDFWKDNPDASIKDTWAKNGVSTGDVFNGLQKLVESGAIKKGILAAIGDPTARFELAMDAIKFVQQKAGLKLDGVIGRFTRSALDRFRGCDESRRSTTPVKPGSRADGAADLGLLFYFVDPDLQKLNIGGQTGKTLIAEAIFAWVQHLNLVMKFVEKEDEANVVLKWDNFGGPGGTLAIADVGGPGVNQKLTLRFDITEHWQSQSPESFISTATHELGHILGLTHASGPGELMSPFKDETITKPKPNDIARAQALWGKA